MKQHKNLKQEHFQLNDLPDKQFLDSLNYQFNRYEIKDSVWFTKRDFLMNFPVVAPDNAIKISPLDIRKSRCELRLFFVRYTIFFLKSTMPFLKLTLLIFYNNV